MYCVNIVLYEARRVRKEEGVLKSNSPTPPIYGAIYSTVYVLHRSQETHVLKSTVRTFQVYYTHFSSHYTHFSSLLHLATFIVNNKKKFLRILLKSPLSSLS
jgi:hypothetical protein